MMHAERDWNGKHRVSGFEQLEFSTEADARAAIELAQQYHEQKLSAAMSQEARYRAAAERAEKAGEEA
jgi:hypothetical protein